MVTGTCCRRGNDGTSCRVSGEGSRLVDRNQPSVTAGFSRYDSLASSSSHLVYKRCRKATGRNNGEHEKEPLPAARAALETQPDEKHQNRVSWTLFIGYPIIR